MTLQSYNTCLQTPKDLKLCKRGYCTAKEKFEVYPSAYANGYAVKVCKGQIPDYKDQTFNQYQKPKQNKQTDLERWFNEEWVNVCQSGPHQGYQICGSGQGLQNPQKYPYCRPLHKLQGTTVKTVNQLSPQTLSKMCQQKRQQPSKRVFLQKGGNTTIVIPDDVKQAAMEGLTLVNNGFAGGTQTGWDRAQQLTGDTIDLQSLADMRTWFARHGPDAVNGGTSYSGYCNWINNGKPLDNKNNIRGAVSWLIWGGDPAYLWLKTPTIRKLLKQHFPDRKTAVATNNLSC